MTNICVDKLTIIGSDNGLSPGRRQAIIRTNAGILLIGPLGTNFSEILIGIQTFSFKEMRLKVTRPQCVKTGATHGCQWTEYQLIRVICCRLFKTKIMPEPVSGKASPNFEYNIKENVKTMHKKMFLKMSAFLFRITMSDCSAYRTDVRSVSGWWSYCHVEHYYVCVALKRITKCIINQSCNDYIRVAAYFFLKICI